MPSINTVSPHCVNVVIDRIDHDGGAVLLREQHRDRALQKGLGCHRALGRVRRFRDTDEGDYGKRIRGTRRFARRFDRSPAAVATVDDFTESSQSRT